MALDAVLLENRLDEDRIAERFCAGYFRLDVDRRFTHRHRELAHRTAGLAARFVAALADEPFARLDVRRRTH